MGFGLSSHFVRCRAADSLASAQSVFSNPRTRIHHVRQLSLILFDLYPLINWRTQSQPIRTISEIFAHIQILPTRQIPLYQKISTKAKQLHTLGMSHNKIARELNTSETTIVRACKYYSN